jgi:sugar diacid utilization regulator
VDAIAPSRFSSVGDLVTVLGHAGLRLASSESSRDLAVTRTALLDPHSPPEATPGGVLLAPGLRAGDDGAEEAVTQAARLAFSAVVVKEYAHDITPLARAADDGGIALLVVHDDVEWLHLDNLLSQALVSASHAGRSLSGAATGDLFALAGAIADTVGGATAIEDFSQRILAYSHRDDQPIDAERREGILGRQVPDLPENAEQYRRLYRSPGVVRYPPSPDGLGRIAVAVRAGRELLGSIWVVDAEGGLDEQAEQSLLRAAPIAALHLLQARSATDLVRRQRGEAARQLLENQGSPREAASILGLAPAGPFAVLAVAVDQGSLEHTERLLQMVTLHCETRLGRTGSVVLGSMVFALVSGSRVDVDSVRSVATDIAAAASGSLRIRPAVGVGPLVRDLQRIPTARQEAARVVSLLARRTDLGPVATATEVSDQLALLALADAMAADARLVTSRARAVLAHDAAHGTSYGEVLRCYLDAARDVAATAERLAVHPNTVRYRVRRAAQLFDLDVADPEQVLPLWLALRAVSEEHPSG